MACTNILILATCFGFFRHAASTAQGALKLDNYTFDKMLSVPEHTLLVKFDQSYAYGEKEDEFKVLCKLAYSVPKFFIGEVPVQEYGDKENDDLKERFGIKKDDFPVYHLFNQANPTGLRYTGATKADDIGAWLRRNKVRMPTVGTIEEMDVLARKFLKDGFSDEILTAAKTLAEGQYSNDKKAPMYVKIMQRIKEKGEGYIASETERVNKILNGKVTPEKVTEMNDKLKILGVFAAKDEL
mmetsp:Transcript_40473/g.77726  ORF Transcript_40473/g.77726 Transcript_40473/m.77726 type:complete len:241 (+) Transcript_40473:52-774(+)